MYERKTMTNMDIIVDNESQWVSFYMKWDEKVFLKVMNTIEEFEEQGNSLNLSPVKLDVKIHRKEIQAKLLPLMEEI